MNGTETKDNNGATEKYLKIAVILAVITVFYNIIEGLVSVYFGYKDETLSLFGFGIDSFVEVISGIGIWHLTHRIKKQGTEKMDKFEITALKVTGFSFYLLSAGLVISAAINFFYGSKPEATIPGIIISLISIAAMWLLIEYKLKTGKALNSEAIIADANCTRTCMYLSIILLIASAGYQLTGLGFLDSIGALGIAYFSFKEGKESLEKAESKNIACSCGH